MGCGVIGNTRGFEPCIGGSSPLSPILQFIVLINTIYCRDLYKGGGYEIFIRR